PPPAGARGTGGVSDGRSRRARGRTTTWRTGRRVGQVFRLARQRTVGGKTTEEVVYGLTSLSREEADAERLLDLGRAHWGIENGLHHTRDETFREDRGRVRRGRRHGPWRRCGTWRCTCCGRAATTLGWPRPSRWPRTPTAPSTRSRPRLQLL